MFLVDISIFRLFPLLPKSIIVIFLNVVRCWRIFIMGYLEGHRSSLQRIWARKSAEGEERRSWWPFSPSWLTIVDCHFQYLPPACNRADATSVDRISSFCRPVFSVPLISIFLHVVRLAVRRLCPFPLPSCICLSHFQQLQQLQKIMEKPRGETEITDVLLAWGQR